MNARLPERLAKVLPPILVLVGLGAFVFYLLSGFSRPTGIEQLDVSFAAAFGMFLPLGAFIAMRRPRHPVGWIMTTIGFSVLVSSAATEYATRGLIYEPGSLPAAAEVAYVSELVGIPGISLIGFLMLLFPTGKLLSSGWRWAARLAGANMVFMLVALSTLWSWRGPVLLRDEPPQNAFVPPVLFEIAFVVVMLSAVLGLVSLVVRFRRSSGVERQQLKWMAYVASLVGTLLLLNFFVLVPFGVEGRGVRLVSEQLLNLAVAGIPVAAAIAISRYHLYDIDLVINRTLVYGLLTGILAGIYVGLVFALQALLAPVTAESDLAIAASTLAVAGLFRPLRSQVQSFIDRRFYRRKFDAQQTVDEFSAHLRDEVDLEALSSQLVSTVENTMQPVHVSLWLRGPQAS